MKFLTATIPRHVHVKRPFYCITLFAVLSSRLLINGCRDSLPLYAAALTFQTTSITLHYIENHIPHAPEQIPVSKILKGARSIIFFSLTQLEQVIFSGRGPWPQISRGWLIPAVLRSCWRLLMKLAETHHLPNAEINWRGFHYTVTAVFFLIWDFNLSPLQKNPLEDGWMNTYPSHSKRTNHSFFFLLPV